MNCHLGDGCICNDYVDCDGYGECKKPHAAFLDDNYDGFALMCYVDLPSNCSDLKSDGQYAGNYYGRSAEACKKGILGLYLFLLFGAPILRNKAGKMQLRCHFCNHGFS